MTKVRPVYKCRRCGDSHWGNVMELSNRPLEELVVDVMDMAEPMAEPHYCGPSKAVSRKKFGVWEYIGFDIV